MNLKVLMDLQELQNRLVIKQEELEGVKRDFSLTRLMDEYDKQKLRLAQCEHSAKLNAVNHETKKNELNNILDNMQSLEKIKYSSDINTVKKLSSIDKELSDLSAKKNDAEDKLIKVMEEGENIERESTELKKKLTFLKKKYISSKKIKEESLQKLQNEGLEIEKKIDEKRQQIDSGIIEVYDKLRKSHSDPIATVHHRICSGCKIEIGALDYERVKAGDESIRCQNCGRILVYIETV